MTHAFLSSADRPEVENHTSSQVYFIVGSTAQERKHRLRVDGTGTAGKIGEWYDKPGVVEHWFGLDLEEAKAQLAQRSTPRVFRISNDRHDEIEHRYIAHRIYRVVELVVHTYEPVAV